MLLYYHVKVETPKMHVNNVNNEIAVIDISYIANSIKYSDEPYK